MSTKSPSKRAREEEAPTNGASVANKKSKTEQEEKNEEMSQGPTELEDMTLYTMSVLPSCRRLEMFLKEKNLEIKSRVSIDVTKGEHKTEEFMKKNHEGRVPLLQLKDGTNISESDAIAQYIEESLKNDTTPKLFGTEPEERALIAAWNRRVELEFIQPLIVCARYDGGLQPLLGRPKQPEFAKEGLRVAEEWLEKVLEKSLEGNTFLNGKALSLPDLSLFALLQFGAKHCGLKVKDELKNVKEWIKEMESRDSAKLAAL